MKSNAAYSEVVKNNQNVAENEMATVEGGRQCDQCQRFAKLGSERLCFRAPGDFTGAAKIIGWVPGECKEYLPPGA